MKVRVNETTMHFSKGQIIDVEIHPSYEGNVYKTKEDILIIASVCEPLPDDTVKLAKKCVTEGAHPHTWWAKSYEPKSRSILAADLLQTLEQARKDYWDFLEWEGGCSCHTNPPCSWCTHPGNMIEERLSNLWLTAYQIGMFCNDAELQEIIDAHSKSEEEENPWIPKRATLVSRIEELMPERAKPVYKCVSSSLFMRNCGCGESYEKWEHLQAHLISKGIIEPGETVSTTLRREFVR